MDPPDIRWLTRLEAPGDAMKLVIDQLSNVPAPFEFDASTGWWQERTAVSKTPEGEVLVPFRFGFNARTMGGDLLLEGSVKGEIAAECGRCLARYRHALHGEFRLVLEPAGERTPTEPEGVEALSRDGVVLGDSLEVGWYKGSEIDLADYFGEVIALSMPVHAVCREGCAGLCPVCGMDRNQAACDCVQKTPESPFAVLAALRDGLTEGKT